MSGPSHSVGPVFFGIDKTNTVVSVLQAIRVKYPLHSVCTNTSSSARLYVLLSELLFENGYTDIPIAVGYLELVLLHEADQA